jgi:hypothetical protein
MPGYHTGDDYGAPLGTKVVAVRNGVVRWSNDSGGAYGKWMGIEADNGRVYVYCHLSVRSVASGSIVKANQVIGKLARPATSRGRTCTSRTTRRARSLTGVAGSQLGDDETLDPVTFLELGPFSMCIHLRKWYAFLIMPHWTPFHRRVQRLGVVGMCIGALQACALAFPMDRFDSERPGLGPLPEPQEAGRTAGPYYRYVLIQAHRTSPAIRSSSSTASRLSMAGHRPSGTT